jgi:uncharacterized membrane protein
MQINQNILKSPCIAHSMHKQTALKAILIISVAGLLFSSYLSYTELFTPSSAFCSTGTCSQQIASIPVCVYGFIMYLIIFVISLLGLKAKK